MDKMKISVLRKKNKDAESYWQSFDYSGDIHIPITTLLEKINRQPKIVDSEGNACEPIQWECSCQQGLCGACALVINGKPGLACQMFCDAVVNQKNEIQLEPLSKFPVICDLMIDRSQMFEAMKEMQLWLEQPAKVELKEVPFQYEVSQCLMCGCCLEVCPNYTPGALFAGAPAAIASVKLIKQSEGSEHKKKLSDGYKNRVFQGCSKSFACQTICPMEIPTVVVMSKMNRLSIWSFWQRIKDGFQRA